MKIFSLLTLVLALAMGLSSGVQAQCSVTFTHSNSGQSFNFNGVVSGALSPNYVWTISDYNNSTTTTLTGQNPSFTFSGTPALGYHYACLQVFDSSGCQATYCDSIYYNGNNPCTFNTTMYNFVDTSSTVNGTVVFGTYSSTGTAPYTYNWDFGDGSAASTLASPTHVYSNPNGFYYACVTMTDAAGCTAVRCDSILPNNPCADPGLFAFFQAAVNGNMVNFFSSIGGNPSSVYWSFGDGGSSTVTNPTHTYNQAGTYTVQLLVTYANGCSRIQTNVVTIGNGNPCAGFSANYTSSATGNVVNFNSTVVGGTLPYSYAWTFGDGNASSQANPTHTYAAAGSYGVTLVVSDTNGCVHTAWDSVVTNQPCTQNEVILALNFDNYAYETSWDVRDAGGNIVANGANYVAGQNGTALTQALCLPTGCYTFNIYDTYGDGICCLWGNGNYSLTDGTTGNSLASGGAFGYSETTSFCVGGATNPCAGFNTQFGYTTTAGNVVTFNAPALTGVQYMWSFGDNTTATGANPVHTYSNTTSNGLYQVCLTAIDASGCTATYCDSIPVSAPPCNNNQVTLTLNFDNFAYETTWDVTDANGNVVYNGAGYTQADNGTTTSLNLCLPTGCYNFNIYDSYGDGICCSWGNGSYVLNGANGVLASGGQFGSSAHTNFCVGGASNPCGSFTGSIASSAGASGAYAFTSNFPIQQPFNYQWSFGDGNTSTLANPNHTYTTNGVYVVCMTADSGNCVVTYCDSIMVTNASNPNNGPCVGMSVNINMVQDTINPFIIYMQPVVNNALNNANINFTWDFGDNTGAQGGSPGHLYNNYGSYVVCITALDLTNGCLASFCDTITLDSVGTFSRNIDYKDVKPGFFVNTLPPVINYFTSVNTIANDNIAIELFPNPAADVVNLSINSKDAMNGEVTILDVAGKAIYNKNINLTAGAQQVTLQVSQFPAGVYLVRLKGDAAQKTMKFIKE